MKKSLLRKNQSGQLIIEYILLLTIFVGISLAVSNYFKSNDVIANLVSSPWNSLAGMIQNGQWGDPNKTMSAHPNNAERSNSLRGEDAL